MGIDTTSSFALSAILSFNIFHVRIGWIHTILTVMIRINIRECACIPRGPSSPGFNLLLLQHLFEVYSGDSLLYDGWFYGSVDIVISTHGAVDGESILVISHLKHHLVSRFDFTARWRILVQYRLFLFY